VSRHTDGTSKIPTMAGQKWVAFNYKITLKFCDSPLYTMSSICDWIPCFCPSFQIAEIVEFYMGFVMLKRES